MAVEQQASLNIQKDLDRLWDEAQGINKIRASLFNLIIYAEKNQRVGHYQSMVRSAVSKFPCRVLMIVSDEKTEQEAIHAQVDAASFGEGDLQAYCEIIQIEVSGAKKNQVPFLALPLILPDLPLYLLWTSDPSSGNSILPSFEKYASRIIFDSTSAVNIQKFCQTVLDLTRRFHCEAGDLGWSALSGWRRTLAQICDTKEALDALSSSDQIKITFQSISETAFNCETEAAYFQAWMASRLNWKFKSYEANEATIRIAYNNAGFETVFLLIPVNAARSLPGSLQSIEIESRYNKGRWAIKRAPGTQQIYIQHSDKNQCDLPFCTYLSGMRAGEEIIEEIFYPKTGKQYQALLELLSAIPWKQG